MPHEGASSANENPRSLEEDESLTAPKSRGELDLRGNAQACLESLYEAGIITLANRRSVWWGVTAVAINLTRTSEALLAPGWASPSPSSLRWAPSSPLSQL